jgi:hypothetical protein
MPKNSAVDSPDHCARAKSCGIASGQKTHRLGLSTERIASADVITMT